ncbi:MAG TPA: ERF family protein [Burkholderiaceae bacterium]|nr:ERF family protein [Burkholderiaceae bacterium]
MTDASKPLNLHQRMNAVRQEVEYIKKKKAVEGYKAVTHDQVTGMLREHLIKFGILTAIRIVNGATVETGTKTKSGTPIVRFDAVYELDFINIDDPKDRETYSTSASALDHGDKAPGKAISYAKKALELKAFDIETGEDDESRYGGNDVDVGELKQAMTDAKTVDELRARTTEALSALGKDHEDYKDVVAYGKSLAARLTAVKQPTAKQAEEPDAPAESPPATKPTTAKGAPASKGLIQSIRNMGHTKGIEDGDLIEALHGQGIEVDKLEDLDKVQAATLLATVTKMSAK